MRWGSNSTTGDEVAAEDLGIDDVFEHAGCEDYAEGTEFRVTGVEYCGDGVHCIIYVHHAQYGDESFYYSRAQAVKLVNA